jgi:hypothetical protein
VSPLRRDKRNGDGGLASIPIGNTVDADFQQLLVRLKRLSHSGIEYLPPEVLTRAVDILLRNGVDGVVVMG